MRKILTLELDARTVQRAESLAERTGKTVSQMVEDYFRVMEELPPASESEFTPIVRSLKGALRGAKVDEGDYRRHLVEKHL